MTPEDRRSEIKMSWRAAGSLVSSVNRHAPNSDICKCGGSDLQVQAIGSSGRVRADSLRVAMLATFLVPAHGCGKDSVIEAKLVERQPAFDTRLLSESDGVSVALNVRESTVALLDRSGSRVSGPMRIRGESVHCVISPSGTAAVIATLAPTPGGLSEYRIFSMKESRLGTIVDTVPRKEKFIHHPDRPMLRTVLALGRTDKFALIWEVTEPLEKYDGIGISVVDANEEVSGYRIRVDENLLRVRSVIDGGELITVNYLSSASADNRLLIICNAVVLAADRFDSAVIALTFDGSLSVLSRALVLNTASGARGNALCEQVKRGVDIRFSARDDAFQLIDPWLLRPLLVDNK